MDPEVLAKVMELTAEEYDVVINNLSIDTDYFLDLKDTANFDDRRPRFTHLNEGQ